MRAVCVLILVVFQSHESLAQVADSQTIGGSNCEMIDDARVTKAAVSAERWEIANGMIIVKFVSGVSRSATDQFADEMGLVPALRSATTANAREYHYQSTLDPIEVLKEVLAKPLVESAVLDTYLKPLDTPNDTYYSRQWNLEKIGLERAWDITGGNSSITVAVIDWGAQYDHEDLAASTWHNPGEIDSNGVDDDGNGFTRLRRQLRTI